MTATSILKGVITGASALALAGVGLAQVSTGTPSSGTALGVTPPPSSNATTDTSRLNSDCEKVAADQRSHAPPYSPMGCDRTRTLGAAGTTDTTGTLGAAGPTASSTTAAAPEAATPGGTTMNKKATKVAKADRG